jgi:threonylcarbamoyladenosine tRNA methylthiotransferase MtaB
MFFSVYTLGCKLNQLETEAVTDAFRGEGFTLVPWTAADRPEELPFREPSLLVVNTCTVTSMADQKARRVIRKALRDHPDACVIVSGCYAQMEKAAIAALDTSGAHRLFVVSGDMKDRLLDLPVFLAASGVFFEPRELRTLVSSWFDSLLPAVEGSGSFRFKPVNFSTHSRGFLKIQDGCNRRCTYCRVSLARGKSRSLGKEAVLSELQSLEKRGIAEAVLTGVNIAQYRDAETGLPALLNFLLEGTERIRVRLSSIEPETRGFSDDFFAAVKNPRIRSHFHLSVQSGSPAVLAKMGRPYTPEDIEKAAALLRSVRDDPFLACDIIAGFPGETEAEFEETLSLCRGIGFAWIHAFPFSPRPGTAAFDMSGRISEKEAARRVELLTELARSGRAEYIGRWIGKEVEAVVETGGKRGFVPAVSENYLKLLVACRDAPPPPGTLLRCEVAEDDTLWSDESRYDACGVNYNLSY